MVAGTAFRRLLMSVWSIPDTPVTVKILIPTMSGPSEEFLGLDSFLSCYKGLDRRGVVPSGDCVRSEGSRMVEGYMG